VLISAASREVRESLNAHGVRSPAVRFEPTLEDAFAAAHASLSPLKVSEDLLCVVHDS
jgi:hypothetical protein